jgi:acetyl esterase/lipase
MGCEEIKNDSGEKEIPMENISYGAHVRQTMDISLPLYASKENKVPVLLCIHGGSWSSGDKKDFEWIKQQVNNFNMAYVSINYRLLGDNATYKQMIDDIHAAITYLRTNSEIYHLKTDKMGMIGGSAGGHLTLLYAYTMNSPIKIACISSMAGPTDFLDSGQLTLNGQVFLPLINKLVGTQITMEQIGAPQFSFPESWYDASPVYHVNANTPPTVLAYGKKDDLVAHTNAERLNDTLQKYNVPHTLISYPNSGHELNKDPDKAQQYWEALAQFINEYLLK